MLYTAEKHENDTILYTFYSDILNKKRF